MTNTELKVLALSYIDRADVADSTLDSMIIIAESRINRLVDSINNAAEFTIPLTGGSSYDIPDDLIYITNIYIYSNGSRISLQQANPEQLNILLNQTDIAQIYYTLSSGRLQLSAAIATGQVVITYNKFVEPISNTNPENWISTLAPDIYLFGLLTELNSFVMAGDAAKMWNTRFETAVLNFNDSTNKLDQYGPALQTRVE